MPLTYELLASVLFAAAAFVAFFAVVRRLKLSLAKHPSLGGHSKMARRFARLLPSYTLSSDRAFDCDSAPAEIAHERRSAFLALAERLQAKNRASVELTEQLQGGLSDLNFTSRYRVPFQFADLVAAHFPAQPFVHASQGVQIQDADQTWLYDLGGSYGVNLFGYDFYKTCMRAAAEKVQALGPVLGPYHPLVVDNVARLRTLSRKAEVSFHMSGTEAVMQAVRLARYHTQRKKIVTLCGSYHGWWDDVQPGVGNPAGARHTLTLRDMDERTLGILQTRKDIACVLVNPLQALHPNKAAPGDGTLLGNGRSAHFDPAAYQDWLRKLRKVCSARNIALIFDEVFVGFRLAPGGAQEFFAVDADLVTYGKTLGGGLPVGALCGDSKWMRRYRDQAPADICFARGTFNSHPLVMAAMNEFLVRLDTPEIKATYRHLHETWNERAEYLNQQFIRAELPLQVANLGSIFTVLYHTPSRYNWMLQFYLRDAGLALSWVGSGRLIFSHNYSNEDFEEVCERMLQAARRMRSDGWWWTSSRAPSITRQLTAEFVRASARGYS